MQAPSLITIDLDGTLVDSAGDLHASVNMMLAQLGGQARSIDQVRSWVGNGVERLVHRALTATMDDDASAADFPEALLQFQNAYQRCNGTLSTLYPGVRTTLNLLKDSQCRLVCITNKAAPFTWPLLQALEIDSYFEQVISGDDLPQKKPHPLPLLHAAQSTGVAPEQCLHVGDSVSDIKAAHAAGFQMACVSYGYNHGIDVRSLEGSLKPDAVLDSFDQLPGLWMPAPVSATAFIGE